MCGSGQVRVVSSDVLGQHYFKHRDYEVINRNDRLCTYVDKFLSYLLLHKNNGFMVIYHWL